MDTMFSLKVAQDPRLHRSLKWRQFLFNLSFLGEKGIEKMS